MMRVKVAIVLSLTLTSALALAKDPGQDDSRHERGEGRRDRRERDEERDGGGRAHRGAREDGGSHEGREQASARSDEEGEEDEGDDGGPPVEIRRSPEQKDLRDRVVGRERKLVEELAHKGGKHRSHLSQRERQVIGVHWRHVMRLVRIRELAEDDHDAATVARADALIDREDKKFSSRLETMAADVDGGTNR